MFVLRNIGFSVKNPRKTWETVKAMRKHRKENPICLWCGRSKKVDVHHKFPVNSHPQLAADPRFFRTLCRKPACHHVVGHKGNWRDVNELVDVVIEANK